MAEVHRDPKRPQGQGSIEFAGGVNMEGKPFVHLFHDDKQIGQLSPAEAIRMGTRAIQSAIEAERDCAIVRAFRKMGGDADVVDRNIASMLTMIREERDQSDPNPDLSVIRGPSDGA